MLPMILFTLIAMFLAARWVARLDDVLRLHKLRLSDSEKSV